MEDAQLIRVLKALAEPKRFRMVQEIAAAGELSCGQVGELFPLSQPAVSHHLKVLQHAGMLNVRAEGQTHFISVNPEAYRALDRLVGRLMAGLPRRKKAAAR
jgi:ArsR family transcriptional regulator